MHPFPARHGHPSGRKKSAVRLKGVAALALMASSCFVSQNAQAANTLLELFQRKQPQEVAPVAPPAPVAPTTAIAPVAVAPVKPPVIKRVVVKGPQIYDYKPEKLVKVDFAAIDMSMTAATKASAVDPLTSGMAPIAAAQPVAYQNGDAAGTDLSQVNVMAEKPIADALIAFYAKKPAFMWSADEKVQDRARSVAAFFANAAEDGLNPDDYAVSLPADGTDAAGQVDHQQKLAQFEIAMSARALRYAIDAGEGRVIADRLSGYHDLPRKRVDPAEVLAKLATAEDPAAYLASFNPNNAEYVALKQQLASLEGGNGKSVRIQLNGAIRPGDSNEQLKAVVALLLDHAPASYLEQHRAVLTQHAESGIYDPELVQAFKDYQTLTGSTPDGVIGRNTIAALQGEQPSSKRDRLIYSMERLRWLPRDFGQRYVFINQPAYRAEYFENGQEKLAMNVVVGSPSHQTYFFYNKVQTVVFNPSWGVPRSIIMNEMLPKAARDPGYLDRNGYEVYSNGEKISAYSVNWGSVASGNSHVSIRQKPSLDNALGELKILFPNAHDIYMHDTPAKSYFKRDMRALSHGCIRLEQPRAMAAAVLGVPVESLDKYFGKNERGVKVAEPVPVYISYFTAWPDKNGKISYYSDVYDRDAGLQKAFDKTSQSRAVTL